MSILCTSFTLHSNNKMHYLARTMDFGFELDGRPVVIPRNYVWALQLGGEYKTKFGFVGTGKNVGNYIVADGMNEKGLAMAELYFLNEAIYNEQQDPNLLNLAPHEFIMWVLGELSSIQELKERINEVNIVNVETELLSTVIPLHFIVTDRTGETVVIENNTGKLDIKNNPVGVMTNSPDLGWHLKNLNNYLSLQPTNFSNKEIDGYEIKPMGQGSGTVGLPGGYSSPERFVRTVYNRSHTISGVSKEENINAIFHILDGVTIPKGVVVKDDGAIDYTQYRAILDVSELKYYFNPYENQSVYSVTLDEQLLNLNEPKEFNFSTNFDIKELN